MVYANGVGIPILLFAETDHVHHSQGVTFLFASGDYGVGSFPGDGGPNGCLKNGTVFNPQYPSGCPYLTR